MYVVDVCVCAVAAALDRAVLVLSYLNISLLRHTVKFRVVWYLLVCSSFFFVLN